jgi:hypothetical protein
MEKILTAEQAHRRNVLKDQTDIEKAERVIQCTASARCTRTIVEYVDAPASRHSRLPQEIVEVMRLNPAIQLVELPCNHHGGQEYSNNVQGRI